MYLRGSKLSMTRRRRRFNVLRILMWVLLIGAMVYVNQVIVPTTGPLFIPTPTPTRSPESYVADAQGLVLRAALSSPGVTRVRWLDNGDPIGDGEAPFEIANVFKLARRDLLGLE